MLELLVSKRLFRRVERSHHRVIREGNTCLIFPLGYVALVEGSAPVDHEHRQIDGHVLQAPGGMFLTLSMSHRSLIPRQGTKNTVLRFLASEAVNEVGSKETIFSELRNGKLPHSEKEAQRLVDEGNILMIAGGEAITQLLTVTSYHLLANPAILARLQEELATVMPEPDTPVTWAQLEQLPYLVSGVRAA